jgi:hypothetical protein
MSARPLDISTVSPPGLELQGEACLNPLKPKGGAKGLDGQHLLGEHEPTNKEHVPFLMLARGPFPTTAIQGQRRPFQGLPLPQGYLTAMLLQHNGGSARGLHG